MFDFKASSKEFGEIVNKEGGGYEINAKILQMKWTDIEIRKYWMQEMKQEEPTSSAPLPEPNWDLTGFHQFDSASDPEECTNLEELD